MNDDLPDYLLVLGKMALTVRIYCDEQARIAQTGILQDDEMEIAQTIEWEVSKLLDIIDSQVALVTGRTPQTWEETLKHIADRLNTGEDNDGNNKPTQTKVDNG